MTDKPEIKVGQRWVTRGGDIVRVLSTDGVGARRVVGQYESGKIGTWLFDGLSDDPLLFFAPTTVKRTVALYRSGFNGELLPEACVQEVAEASNHWNRISEPLEIEFTLLPGEEP